MDVFTINDAETLQHVKNSYKPKQFFCVYVYIGMMNDTLYEYLIYYSI